MPYFFISDYPHHTCPSHPSLKKTSLTAPILYPIGNYFIFPLYFIHTSLCVTLYSVILYFLMFISSPLLDKVLKSRPAFWQMAAIQIFVGQKNGGLLLIWFSPFWNFLLWPEAISVSPSHYLSPNSVSFGEKHDNSFAIIQLLSCKPSPS